MTRPDWLPEPREEWSRYDDPNPFIGHVGPMWYRPAEGGFEHAFLIAPLHGNTFHVVHGGMTAAFADHALGISVWLANGRGFVVTAHLDVNFIAAAKIGQLMRCRPEIVRRTRSLTFVRGDIVADGKIVATASGVWKLVGG